MSASVIPMPAARSLPPEAVTFNGPIFWTAWALLAGALLLNANSVLVLAGAPERYFTPLILVLALAVVGARVGQWPLLGRAPLPALLVFAFVFLSTGLWAATASSHVRLEDALPKVPLYGGSLLILIGAAFTTAHAAEHGRLRLLLHSLFWPSVLASLSGVLFIAVPAIGNLLALQPGERLHGVFSNTNELGGQAGYALVLGLTLTMLTRRATYAVVGTAAGIVGVVSSFSKAAMLGFLPLIALLVYALSGARFRLRPMLLLLITSVVVAIGLRLLASAFLDGAFGIELSTDQRLRLEAIMEIIATGALDDTATTGRSSVWAVGLEHWSRSPVLGLGLGAFDRVRGVDMEIHNTFLRVLGEGGIPALLTFLVLVFALALTVLREERPAAHVLAIGVLLVLLPVMMSTGGILLARNHVLLVGCMVGWLATTAVPEQH